MISEVYFVNMRTVPRRGLIQKLKSLIKRIDLAGMVSKNELFAIKMHFGESGNTAYLRPEFVRPVVEAIKEREGKPFLTDTNTLYVGTRGDTVSHLRTAMEHGFDYSAVGAPAVIADGLFGNLGVDVAVNLDVLDSVKIAPDIHYADGLVAVTHFKGHELFGFGGALKNVGMGCANREGKLKMHSDVSPSVDENDCTGCKICLEWCNYSAIVMAEKKARIIEEKCVGCGLCIPTCPEKAIDIRWNAEVEMLHKKTAEYAYGVISKKKGKCVFLNYLINIAPGCDCYGSSDAPIVQDIGILASLDPVAIDRASVDLVNQQPGIPNTALGAVLEPGADKFGNVWPGIDWSIQLVHAEKIGIGTQKYTLIEVK
ncbi:MAG TPA: DUF362 domain-containing protein [bacterium]